MISEKQKTLAEKLHKLIPGGAHTYSKGDDQFPSNAPRILSRGKGSHVWDVDGAEYIDWGMGLRSVILGHAYPSVVEAAKKAMDNGTNFCRPHTLELELAELLIQTIPCAQMVKFAKNGSDATTGAIKLARAFTGRNKVAICKEHPFFSVHDWFIGTTVVNAGVPKAVSDLSLNFHYNDIESLKKLFEEHPDQIACVVLEATTGTPPSNGFLQQVKDLAHKHGAVFLMDEIITGFRYGLKGAQAYFGVTPDLATFAKGVANGFSFSVLAGRADIMELGGIRHSKDRVFLLSTTYGAETHAMAAAKATVEEIRDKPVTKHVWDTGKKLKEGINAVAKKHGMGSSIQVGGYDCSPNPMFKDSTGSFDFALKTYIMQEIFKVGGVLFPGYFAPSFSHSDADIEKTIAAFDVAIARAANLKGDYAKHVEGPIVKPVFRKRN